ncbi:MAG TPA: alpha-amylase family glycosyl hydrolase [Polyangia bacterium]|nr:alpha-amylase family glycosyl hydrolase [Polyangia bacterium]
MVPDILARRQLAFVLWRPGQTAVPPSLVIGTFNAGPPASLKGERTLAMRPVAGFSDLYELPAAACGLTDGTVYHYWFEVADTDVYLRAPGRIRITDPTAFSVDWRLTYVLPAPYNQTQPTENVTPAAVVRFAAQRLVASDAEGPAIAAFDSQPDVAVSQLPPNERLVIYELPTAWTRAGDLVDAKNVGVGTFRDVRALVDKNFAGGNFGAVAGDQHLIDLGANALELLPPADTYLDRRSWGYGTSNYFAPDFDLGRPLSAASSTAVGDLLALVRACHQRGIRFFYDAVMAFAKQDPYRFANFLDFHVQWNAGDPEQDARDGFGGDLWKYAYAPSAYDPLTGTNGNFHPARRHMIAHLLHWLGFFHVDGLRLDSVNNFRSWDFASDIRQETRAAWRDRVAAETGSTAGADERFLVIGEELSVPKGLLAHIDALWNEDFKRIARNVLLGRNWDQEPSFEWSVRKLIDCRNLGFSRGYQAVNYLGSHDVGGIGNERLFNYLGNNGVNDADKRIRLGFACLLTAVGIPMILAGDEFAQPHHNPQVTDTNKEIDPINFELKNDPWRAALFAYVSRLVALRTSAGALAVDDVDFLHVDFTEGKRVLVWRRGRPGVDDPVVVIANFSDWGSDPGGRYHVPSWPATLPGKRWREVTRARDVPQAWIGEEPLYPWEAKVYLAV